MNTEKTSEQHGMEDLTQAVHCLFALQNIAVSQDEAILLARLLGRLNPDVAQPGSSAQR